MGEKTDDYLAKLFAESFKREVDADEAVWRSLPFFAAAFGLALAVLGPAFASAPALSSDELSVAIYGQLVLAAGAFLWASRWFWGVIRLREYQYPPTDVEIDAFAIELNFFHAESGLSGEALDTKVMEDVRAYMTRQLAAASTRNRENNFGKQEARSQVLLFMIVGFGFAISSEATIFISNASQPAVSPVPVNGVHEHVRTEAAKLTTTRAARASGAPSSQRRGELLAREGNGEKLGAQKVSDPKPPPPAKPAPERPTPPAPHYLKKNEGPPVPKR